MKIQKNILLKLPFLILSVFLFTPIESSAQKEGDVIESVSVSANLRMEDHYILGNSFDGIESICPDSNDKVIDATLDILVDELDRVLDCNHMGSPFLIDAVHRSGQCG